MTFQQSSPRVGEGNKAKSQWSNWPLGAVFMLIATVTFTAYIPALSGDFIWDDAGHVTSLALQSWNGLGRIWFEIGATQQYYPLLHTAFWIEHSIWGDAPAGYHLINILWHVISATLLVVILRRLSVPGALLAGLIFALHPVGVESVAWISEQKNTLSTVFYLAAFLAWLSFEEDRSAYRYAVATLLFIAALLTKSVTATLPALLMVVAWWRRGKISWRNDIIPLVPWISLGILAGLTTSWFESTQIGAKHGTINLDAVSHVLLAGRIICFYLGKLLWPVNLTFFYPFWRIDASNIVDWVYPVAIAACITVLLLRYRAKRSLLAVSLLFCGTLFPVLGFVNVYPFIFSYVADHFQYQASIWMIAFFAASISVGLNHWGWARWIQLGCVGLLVVMLGCLTWQQCTMYKNIRILYETTLERNPSSWVANLNLGIVLDDEGETEKSLPYLKQALALKPGLPETLNSLGNVLNKLGRSTEALPLLEEAVKREPRFAAAYNSLGVALISTQRINDGIAAFTRAAELEPKWALPQLNLGWALANSGRLDLAINQFEKVLILQPNSVEAESKLGLTRVMQGKYDDALNHLKRAVTLQPDDAELRYSLGRVLLQLGQRSAAIEQFEETLRLEPNHAAAKEVLNELSQTGLIR